MNTSIKINNEFLPTLLGKIGEALGKGVDLEISESSYEGGLRYVYTHAQGESKTLLGKEGSENINVETDSEDMTFTPDEIKMMEETKICPESEDETDVYNCNFLCPLRHTCEWR